MFVDKFQRSKDEIIFVPEFYNAPVNVFYKTVAALDESLNSIAIFAHNPGVTDFANSLTSFRIDDMPTCGMFGIKIHSNKKVHRNIMELIQRINNVLYNDLDQYVYHKNIFST